MFKDKFKVQSVLGHPSLGYKMFVIVYLLYYLKTYYIIIVLSQNVINDLHSMENTCELPFKWGGVWLSGTGWGRYHRPLVWYSNDL